MITLTRTEASMIATDKPTKIRWRWSASALVLAAALTGYAGRAYGQCANAGGSTYQCSGTNTTTQTVTANDAAVATDPGFSVDTTVSGGNAITITGDGAISYTDANASPLTAAIDALYIRSGGDNGLTPGSVTIETDGILTSGGRAINARNLGSGAITIIANGDVTANNAGVSVGISAFNRVGGDLTITTAAGATVTGGTYGIAADNDSSGALTITANGNVTSTTDSGISAFASGAGIDVTTGATVTGGGSGIYAANYGSGAITITANGDVTGADGSGIFAYNSAFATTTGIDITTGAGTTVAGSDDGIDANNWGSGALSITANGNVTGANNSGIAARNAATATDLSIITDAGAAVTGYEYGIRARNDGSGTLTITANGNVSGAGDSGIDAENYGADLTITTAAGATVEADSGGVRARNNGSGALTVTANGDVTGGEYGIDARNNAGTDLTVTTGAGATVTGRDAGIRADNSGSGVLTITANGSVVGTYDSGIDAENYGADLTITTAAGATVTGGYDHGIRADNSGSGALTITANGDVVAGGAYRAGINAENYGSTLTITTGVGTTVTGGYNGITAYQFGSGELAITVNGDVAGADGDGVFVYYNTSGSAADIALNAGATVTSNGADADDFAIDIKDGAGAVTVAGTLNGGTGGAVRFDQADPVVNSLELVTGAIVNGNVVGGSGADTLALSGAGAGAFDLAQLANFETGAKNDAGTWTLTGVNTEISDFTISAGLLAVNGGLENAVFTVTGGALGGSGTVGTTSVADGGAIAPGNSPGALNFVGDLSLSAGSILDFELGAPGGVAGVDSDLINVSNNLTLDGMLNITDIGGFGEGAYRLINYGGALTDNGLDLGLLPAGFALGDLEVQTSVVGEVNLVVSGATALSFWDGGDETSSGSVDGGAGVWNATGANWTSLDGGTNGAYDPGVLLVFQGAPGLVTVDNSLGAVSTVGMQFAVDGYMIAGDPLTLVGPQSVIRVGDGTAAGADYAVVISSNLAGSATLEKTDLGTLILTGDNSFTGGATIADGTLQLGDGGTSGSIPGDVQNDGTLAFNRSDDIAFDGVISGAGAIRQIGAGLTNFTGDSSGFAGSTSIEAGTLAVNGSLCGEVNVLSGARLQGVGTVCDTNNFAGGAIAPGNSIGTLTVDGDYVGDGGTLEIEAALGGDASPADRLVITGATSGQTNVQVVNLGGSGAQTVEGIRIVDVGGASDGAFTLIGDYVFEGDPAVIAGAYAYRLYKIGVSTPADGDWYLRSTLKEEPVDPVDPVNPPAPLYQPGVPLFEAYPQALLALNETPTLRQRTGARQWKNGVWGRAEGELHRARPKTSTSGTRHDVDLARLEAGVDVALREGEDGALVGGLIASYGQSFADVSSVFGAGDIDTAAYGAGATLTWHGENGFYADLQGRANWYDSEIESDTLGWTLDNDGSGQSASLEVGRRVRVGGGVTVIPQMQHVYSRIGFDAFTDPAGAAVSRERAESFQGRYSIALDYSGDSARTSGEARGLHAYAIANLYYEYLDGARVVDVSGTKVAGEDEPLWGGLGLGGSFDWNERFSLYGEASADTTLNGFGDSYRLNARIGLRAAF